MRLRDYLEKYAIPQAAFARKIGVTQVAVSRYASGARFPGPDHLIRIEEATRRRVKAADFIKERRGLRA